MIPLMLAALLAGAPAAEPPTAKTPPVNTAEPAAATGETPKRNDIVCKREAVVGSRMPTRVCLSREDWDQRRQEGRDELKKIQQGQPFEAR